MPFYFRLVGAYVMINGVLNRTATQININADCNGATSVIRDRTDK